MGDVVNLDCITTLDLPPDRILDGAKDELKSVVILGWNKEGEYYFASSVADGGDILWLMEKTKKYLLEIGGE